MNARWIWMWDCTLSLHSVGSQSQDVREERNKLKNSNLIPYSLRRTPGNVQCSENPRAYSHVPMKNPLQAWATLQVSTGHTGPFQELNSPDYVLEFSICLEPAYKIKQGSLRKKISHAISTLFSNRFCSYDSAQRTFLVNILSCMKESGEGHLKYVYWPQLFFSVSHEKHNFAQAGLWTSDHIPQDEFSFMTI